MAAIPYNRILIGQITDNSGTQSNMYINTLVIISDQTNQSNLPLYNTIYSIYLELNSICFPGFIPPTGNVLRNSNIILSYYSYDIDPLSHIPPNLSDPRYNAWKSSSFPLVYRLQTTDINNSATNNVWDLYDVCAGIQGARKIIAVNGVSTTIYLNQYSFESSIGSLCTSLPNTKIALGVKFDNPYYERAIRMYLNAGFGNPTTNNRLYNSIIQSFPFLRLTLECDKITKNKTLVNVNLKIANTLRQLYTKYAAGHSINIYMSNETNNYIQDQLVKERTSVLSGGSMNETGIGFILVREAPDLYKLSYVCGYEQKTPETQDPVTGQYTNFYANPPNIPIYMHTHPQICLRQFGCLYAWPSGGDLDVDFERTLKATQYNIPTLSLVASPEGYYIQQYNSFVIKLMKGNSNVNNFIVLLFMMFTVPVLGGLGEQNRTTSRNLQAIAYNNLTYISQINSITINSCVDFFQNKLRETISFDPNSADFQNFINSIRATISRVSGELNSRYNHLQINNVAGPLINGGNWIDTYHVLERMTQAADNTTAHTILSDYIRLGNMQQYATYIQTIVGQCVDQNNTIIPDAGNEPLFISNFMNDFVINPSQDKSLFKYYNYTVDIPDFKLLQDISITTSLMDPTDSRKFKSDISNNLIQTYSGKADVNNIDENDIQNALTSGMGLQLTTNATNTCMSAPNLVNRVLLRYN
jgi:hypothetical protein